MASPLAKGLFQKAIGESGAEFGAGPHIGALHPLAGTEETGQKFAESIGATSLAALRALPAGKLLEESAKEEDFDPNIDGYFLPQDVNTNLC